MIQVKRETGPGAQGLEALIRGLGDKQGKVGWFPEAQYADGTPVAYVASIQEFGSPKNRIPPRSFFRTTIQEKSKDWQALVASGARAVLNNALDPEDVVQGLVLRAESDVKEKISEITEPKLSDLTLLVRKYKLGLIPGMESGKVGGRTLGILWNMYSRGDIDTAGVSDKPLIEPGTGGGHLLATLSSQVE
jgi:hypothetical protein